jgi:hypothetical protein
MELIWSSVRWVFPQMLLPIHLPKKLRPCSRVSEAWLNMTAPWMILPASGETAAGIDSKFFNTPSAVSMNVLPAKSIKPVKTEVQALQTT